MKKFFVVGDSHVNFFGGHEFLNLIGINYKGKLIDIRSTNSLIENFVIFHLGPVLTYNLDKYGSKNLVREKMEFLTSSGLIPKGVSVLCCFGEIDLRVHVLKQAANRKVHFEIVADDVLNIYGDFLKKLKSDGYDVYVWGPIPSQKDNSPLNPEFPYFGTEKERNIATEYFNQRLKTICTQGGVNYLSIFDKLVDENYKTKEVFIADGCHLSQKAWIFAIDEFKKFGVNISFTEQWFKNLDAAMQQA